MSLHTYIERMRYVDYLIRRKATGNVCTLARKLRLSRSQTLRLIKEMREEGFPINYSMSLNSYYYSKGGRLVPRLFSDDLTQDEMQSVNGGQTFFEFFLESHYMRLERNSFVE